MPSENENSYMSNKKNYTVAGQVEVYRYRMVKCAIRNGISHAAREYKTNRPTVRKWVNKYNEALPTAKSYEDELNALRNKSRLGQYHPNKLSIDDELKIIKMRGNTRIGAYMIKDALGLTCSEKTIHKKLKQHGKIKKSVTRTQRKRDMSEMRKAVLPLTKFQIDVKYLNDIPNIYEDVIFGCIPKYQITVRDYKSGLTFIGYSYKNKSKNIAVFVHYVVWWLLMAGVDISKIHFQSDNGS
jgi:hypothetical protein